jgi:two-component system NarL family response regulator
MSFMGVEPERAEAISRNGAIRVVLADPRVLNLQGLAALLQMNGVVVVGTTSQHEQIDTLVRDLQPDILLMDASMACALAQKTWLTMKRNWPELKALLLADPESAARFAAKQPAESRGIVKRDDEVEKLMQAIQTVASGETWMLPMAKPPIRQRGRRMSPLSKRECEITALITQGYANRDISQRLGLSEQSVKNLVSRILKKQGLKNRTQIALWQLAAGADERNSLNVP